MKRMGLVAALTASIALCGCSTIISGTSQKISVATDPDGADCSLKRDGISINRVNPTPGIAEVSTNRSAIAVTCKKEGYQDATAEMASQFDPAVLGNVIAGGLIGIVVDASSGAASRYDKSVFLTLQPIGAASASAATTTAADGASQQKPQ